MTVSLIASARGKRLVGGWPTIDSTGANFLIASIVAASSTVIDSKGNTWTALTQANIGGYVHRIYYCAAPTSVGSGHEIKPDNYDVSDCEIHFYAFSTSVGYVFDVENTATDGTYGGASSDSLYHTGSLSVTPTVDDSFVFCGVCLGSGTPSAASVNSGFTLGHTHYTPFGDASAYLNQTTAAAVLPIISWTGSCRWSASVASFKPVGDTTAPVLTSPTGTQTGSTTANVGATTDEGNGTMYGYVSASATPPSAVNLKAGTGAVWSGSQAISTTGAQTLGATGLTASTSYYGHVIHTDAAANDSNIVTSAQFTTAAPSASNAPRSHYYQMMRSA